MMKPLLNALLTASIVSCAAPSIDAGLHYGQYGLDGELGFETGALGGQVAATSGLDQIGLGEDSDSVGADLVFNLGVPTLVVSGVQTSYSGSGTLQGDLSLDDFDFAAGAAVDSNLDVGMYQALLLFEVFPGDTVDLALGVGVDALDLKGDFTAVDSNSGLVETASFDQMIPVPVLGGRAAIELGPVNVSALVTWIGVDVDETSVEMLDLNLRAGIDVYGPLHLFGGYRDNSLDVEYVDGTDTGKLDLSLSGPYVGIGASF